MSCNASILASPAVLLIISAEPKLSRALRLAMKSGPSFRVSDVACDGARSSPGRRSPSRTRADAYGTRRIEGHGAESLFAALKRMDQSSEQVCEPEA
jgi:hypothetical protein